MMVLKGLMWLVLGLMLCVIVVVQYYKVDDLPLTALKARWANASSSFIEVQGIPLHLRVEGPVNDQLPILLLHGTGASLHTWDGWVESLKMQRQVIRFDLPAFGLTGPAPDNDYSIERYTEIVIGVLDELNISQVAIAGNSLGGYIAWATAVRYPDRVSSLVLVDASGYPYDAESVPIAFKLSKNPLAKSLLKNFLPRALVRHSIENVYGNPALVSDALVERYYQLTRRKGNRDAIKQRFIQTQPGPLMQKLPSLTIPTLILWGQHDQLIPVKFAHRFNREIANSQLILFEQLGHVPHEEAPAQTVRPVKAFLDAHQPDSINLTQ